MEASVPETANAAVATAICGRCGGVMAFRPGKIYCSEHCRFKAWDSEHPRQGRLVMDPPVEPIQILDVGPTTAQIQRAQAKQTVRVLHALQDAGPRGVTTGEFLEAHIGRFSARIGELRAVGWAIKGTRESDHAWRFVLEGRQ
jgi:hypothetical protein